MIESPIEQIETDNCWRCAHTEFTCVFPTEHALDDAVTRAIWRFDPQYVPVYCRKEYTTPTHARVCFGYHIIGRHIPEPQSDPWAAGREPLRILERPSQGWKFNQGAIYEQKTWADMPKRGTQAYREGWPPLFRPHDWRLHNWMEQTHKFLHRSEQSAKQSYREFWRAQKEAEEKELATVQDDARRSLKADRHMVRKAIENEDIYLEPDPDPQQYAQASKVMEGTT